MSCDSISDILEKLSEWSETDVKTNINEVMPTLLSTLSSDNVGQNFQVVQALLLTCLPCVPVTNVEEKLFQHAIPAAKQLFSQAIDCIYTNLEESGVSSSQGDNLLDKIGHIIGVCTTILQCSAAVLEYISAQGCVGVSCIYSVPENIATILFESYRLCKESKTLYMERLASVAEITELLTELFKRAQRIQVQFFNILVENVQFKCFEEEELQLLIRVLEIICNGGEILFCLELKSMVEQWKGYTRLTQKYMSFLGSHLDLQKPLSVLGTEVERLIGEVIKAPTSDTMLTSKCLKVANFLLKIILKLVEQFSGGHLSESTPCLFTLLLTLYSLSSDLRRDQNLTAAVIEEIKTYIIVAADPLLGFLFKEPSFRQEFFTAVDNQEVSNPESSGDKKVPIPLVVAVIKLILHCSPTDRYEWTCNNPSTNIFSVLFSTIKFVHEDLIDDKSIELVLEKSSKARPTDFYSSLVAYGGALILSAPVTEIEIIENVLLDNILQPNPWPALLASDLWIILARSASSKMCYDQIVFLSDSLRSMIDAKIDCPEKRHLCSLLRRLVPLLSSQHKTLFADKYPPKSQGELWREIGLENLPEKSKTSATHDLVSSVQESLADFRVTGKVTKMISALRLASAVLKVDTQSISPTCVASVWNLVPSNETSLSSWLTTSEVRDSVSCWLEDFLCNLCEVTSYVVIHMDNLQTLQVLQRLRAAAPCSSSVVKLTFLKILRSLSEKLFEVNSDQSKVCSEVASLFADLLQDKNPMVGYCTLETFSEFAHKTTHANIFTDTVAGNPVLKTLVTNYFQKSLPVTSVTDEFHSFVHVCETKDCTVSSPPSKKLKVDDVIDLGLDDDFLLSKDFFEEELHVAVEKLTQSCADVLNYAAGNGIPEEVIIKLKTVVSDLQSVIEKK